METKTGKGKEIKIPGPDHSFSIRLYAPERISGENRRDRAAFPRCESDSLLTKLIKSQRISQQIQSDVHATFPPSKHRGRQALTGCALPIGILKYAQGITKIEEYRSSRILTQCNKLTMKSKRLI